MLTQQRDFPCLETISVDRPPAADPHPHRRCRAAALLCAGGVLLAALLLAPGATSAAPPYWSDDLRLTESGAESLRPVITAGYGGQLHVVWDDARELDLEVYYKNWNGATWTFDEALTSG